MDKPVRHTSEELKKAIADGLGCRAEDDRRLINAVAMRDVKLHAVFPPVLQPH